MPITTEQACERFRNASWIVAVADSRLVQEWGGEPVAGLRVAGFAQTLAKHIACFRPEDLQLVLSAAESCLAEGDEATRCTLRTCFFGSLRSLAEQGAFDPGAIEPLLGAASAACWQESARHHTAPARRQGAA